MRVRLRDYVDIDGLGRRDYPVGRRAGVRTCNPASSCRSGLARTGISSPAACSGDHQPGVPLEKNAAEIGDLNPTFLYLRPPGKVNPAVRRATARLSRVSGSVTVAGFAHATETVGVAC